MIVRDIQQINRFTNTYKFCHDDLNKTAVMFRKFTELFS